MNYPLKSSNSQGRKRQANKKVLITIVSIVLLALLFLTQMFKNTLFFIAQPIWRIESSIANSSFGEYFKFKQTLINERLITEQKLFQAGNLLAENEMLRNENEILKDLLDRKDLKQKTVLARVLVKPPRIPYDSLIIDIGDNYNLKVGSKVLTDANIYIGEVSAVYPNSAKILLYSSPGEKRAVVLGASSVSVEAVGIGGGNFNIFLPREIEVKEGDVIIIPSITPNIFGIVEKVNFKDKDSFQTVLFKSPVNISELTWVEVIL